MVGYLIARRLLIAVLGRQAVAVGGMDTVDMGRRSAAAVILPNIILEISCETEPKTSITSCFMR